MANEQNLIPFSQRSESERKEIARKGGIASGEARRRKRDMMNSLLLQCLVFEAIKAEYKALQREKSLTIKHRGNKDGSPKSENL